MARCVYCNAKMSWFLIFKKLFIIKGPDIQCPACHKRLYFTNRSKKWLVGMTILIPLLFILSFMLGYMPLFMVMMLGYMIILPWFVTVTDKDGPLL
ncbi:hypothetical protein LCL96_14660 [Rossellomorea aquimaris]|uniref:TIGR04104 family putative zinc finger protein n=1 Tax=Rossellomorea aquimaris TaxID=189382 RepID=UPI001CD73A46|nr:TIGR04104 family putative zinc finger protein [Rossellomorea aquimaris]MCA1060177.1 hypothetical protein [Rossellomorea aquimaris]